MPNLYNLGQHRQMILDKADELDEQTLLDTLESIDEAIELKIENTASLVNSLKNDVQKFKDEEQRLAKRRKVIENNIQRINQWVLDSMKVAGVKKVNGQFHSVSIRNNPLKLDIQDESNIPKSYYVAKDPELNKRELLQDMKLGTIEVDGVELIRTESVQYK